MSKDDQATSPTLLGRLKSGISDAAWSDFVDRYAATVFSWAAQAGLQESDAADVTQEVLLKLLHHMRSFEYQPGRGSFRGWLKTITVNAARDLGRKNQRRQTAAANLDCIQDPHKWDELACRMEEEYQRELLEQAVLLVRPRVAESTWQAYQLTAIENRSAAQVAELLDLKVSEVYVAKSRMIKRLRQAVAELERIDSGELGHDG